MLWHTAAREAPEGDIGKLTNEDIAIALDWNREPGDLIGGFTHAGLIDEHPAHRLIIHDWAEHAEDSVHSKIARSRRFFCDGKAPKITGLRKADAEAAATFYANNPAATPAQPVDNPSSTTNQALPNQTRVKPMCLTARMTQTPKSAMLSKGNYRRSWLWWQSSLPHFKPQRIRLRMRSGGVTQNTVDPHKAL